LPGLQPGECVLVKIEGGEDEYAARQVGGADLSCRLHAIEGRHADVHQHDVRLQGVCLCYTGGAVVGLADDFDVVGGVEDQAKPMRMSGWSSTTSTVIVTGAPIRR
jgi:hypothetical protein